MKELTNRLNNIEKSFKLLSEIFDNLDTELNIYKHNKNIQDIIIKVNNIYMNSYSIIESDFYNVIESDSHNFNLDSFYTIADGYIFYLTLTKNDNINDSDFNQHDVVLISGFSEAYKYVIIFPCLNKIRKVKTLEDLINDYVKVKIDEGFKFSGYYGMNLYPTFLDLYYLIEYIIITNIDENNVDVFLGNMRDLIDSQ